MSKLVDRRKLLPSLSAARSVTRAKQEGYTVFMMIAIALAIVGCMRRLKLSEALVTVLATIASASANGVAKSF